MVPKVQQRLFQLCVTLNTRFKNERKFSHYPNGVSLKVIERYKGSFTCDRLVISTLTYKSILAKAAKNIANCVSCFWSDNDQSMSVCSF